MFNTFEGWAKGAIGKPMGDVVRAVSENGGCVRIDSVDGFARDSAGVAAIIANRANLTVEDGLVTKIAWG